MTNITPATAPIKQVSFKITNLQGKVLKQDIHDEAEAHRLALLERASSGAPVQIKRVS